MIISFGFNHEVSLHIIIIINSKQSLSMLVTLTLWLCIRVAFKAKLDRTLVLNVVGVQSVLEVMKKAVKRQFDSSAW